MTICGWDLNQTSRSLWAVPWGLPRIKHRRWRTATAWPGAAGARAWSGTRHETGAAHVASALPGNVARAQRFRQRDAPRACSLGMKTFGRVGNVDRSGAMASCHSVLAGPRHPGSLQLVLHAGRAQARGTLLRDARGRRPSTACRATTPSEWSFLPNRGRESAWPRSITQRFCAEITPTPLLWPTSE